MFDNVTRLIQHLLPLRGGAEKLILSINVCLSSSAVQEDQSTRWHHWLHVCFSAKLLERVERSYTIGLSSSSSSSSISNWNSTRLLGELGILPHSADWIKFHHAVHAAFTILHGHRDAGLQSRAAAEELRDMRIAWHEDCLA